MHTSLSFGTFDGENQGVGTGDDSTRLDDELESDIGYKSKDPNIS